MVAGIVTALAVVGILLAFGRPEPGWYNYAQAHEDGTSHIHVTPTPTPPPPLGLNGPLSLDTHATYHDANRRLVITVTINNPPPEGWEFEHASVSIEANHNDWNLSATVQSWNELQGLVFSGDHFAVDMALPDYADFNRLTEPVLARVNAGLSYRDRASSQQIWLNENMYIDLNDRDNWVQ